MAIDTNIYAAAAAFEADVTAKIRSFGGVAMPLPVIAELRFGFAAGNRREANER